MTASEESGQGVDKLLVAEGISKYFGGMPAVKDLDFYVRSGEIFGIAGPNGAGKTTLFNVVSKTLPLDQGKIMFDGQYIERLPPHKVCLLGIARTFQIPALFRSLTVYRNALVGATFGNRNKIHDKQKLVSDVLQFLGLLEKRNVIAEELSLFDRKLLMIASALTTEPKLLMLDEPIAGLSGTESQNMIKTVRELRRRGMSVMIIEHVMDFLMNISDRVMVLHHGEKICEGPPENVCADERVIGAYLGQFRMSESEPYAGSE